LDQSYQEIKSNTNNTEKKPVPFLNPADFDAKAWIKEQWLKVLITEEPREEKPLIYINHIPIATPSNHILITGKKKSRKTLFIVQLLSQCECDLETEVLVFDTEQGQRHVWKLKDRIKRLTGKDVAVFFLRGQSIDNRKKIIEQTIEFWDHKPKLIVIDGIRDLMSNINSPEESTDLITWLETLIVKFQVHIINVLHLNKTDSNARGHIGTELLNKAETTIELENDTKTGVTTVKCESSRDKPFETFAFTHDSEELPTIVSRPIKGEVLSNDDKKNRLRFIFDGNLLKRKDLIAGINMHFKVGNNYAGRLLGDFIRDGWIVKNGPDHSKDTVYKLGI